jgi:diamine N-acetyltransferase
MSSYYTPQTLTLANGDTVTIRSLAAEDGAALFDYFQAFPEESKGFFGPHAFDRETLEQCCHNQSEHYMPLVAVHEGRIVAYFILCLHVSAAELERMPGWAEVKPASVAPSALPESRGTGLTPVMMETLFARARQAGKTHAVLMGGMHTTNTRALGFYFKCGFRVIGEWGTDPVHYDMGLEL